MSHFFQVVNSVFGRISPYVITIALKRPHEAAVTQSTPRRAWTRASMDGILLAHHRPAPHGANSLRIDIQSALRRRG